VRGAVAVELAVRFWSAAWKLGGGGAEGDRTLDAGKAGAAPRTGIVRAGGARPLSAAACGPGAEGCELGAAAGAPPAPGGDASDAPLARPDADWLCARSSGATWRLWPAGTGTAGGGGADTVRVRETTGGAAETAGGRAGRLDELWEALAVLVAGAAVPAARGVVGGVGAVVPAATPRGGSTGWRPEVSGRAGVASGARDAIGACDARDAGVASGARDAIGACDARDAGVASGARDAIGVRDARDAGVASGPRDATGAGDAFDAGGLDFCAGRDPGVAIGGLLGGVGASSLRSSVTFWLDDWLRGSTEGRPAGRCLIVRCSTVSSSIEMLG